MSDWPTIAQGRPAFASVQDMNSVPMLGAPTASGKTSAAIALALQLRGRVPVEIVTADAMQVYLGMDIGTAKPGPEERALVPHHLLDLVTPAEPFSVARWVAEAEQVLGEVIARGAVPLVVGGTGFYLRSLAHGLPLVPPADPELQKPILEQLEREGLDALRNELAGQAPVDSDRAGLNPRRVVRALEILRSTGRPPSSFGRSEPRFRFSKLVLLPDTAQLAPRISARAEQMFAAGLVDEVQGLLERWPEQLTATQAIGYKEVVAHLRGETSLAEAKEAVRLATSQYAKRQLTWFRREPDARSLPGLAHDNLDFIENWLLEAA